MEGFNYRRLDLARRRRGMTKGSLAEQAGIAPRNLLAYEKHEYEPDDGTVKRLAAAVGFPVRFLFGPDLDEPTTEGASFRSMTRMPARLRDQALGSGALAYALSDWIDQRFNLPRPDVPEFPGLDSETAAEAVREAWGLGVKRVANMIHLLEAHGVRVFSLTEESTKVDAFSQWRGSIPYVFLNTQKSAERSRMDAAHELGHLVLHAHGGPRGREAEHEAQAFGSAFLMPAASVLAEAPRNGNFDDLLRAKYRWKVALANLAYRMNKLGMLTEWQYRGIFIELNRRGGREVEPTVVGKEAMPRETSQVLEKVFQALREDKITKAAISTEMGIPMEDIHDSVFGLVLTSLVGGGEDTGAGPGRNAGRFRVV